MRKELRTFKLHTPVIDTLKVAMLLPAMVSTYGIFYFNEEDHLKKVITYDLDSRKIQVPFANIFGSEIEIPFKTEEEIRAEIDRIRNKGICLPTIATASEEKMIDIFSEQEALLDQLRVIMQYLIVYKKFQEENDF